MIFWPRCRKRPFMLKMSRLFKLQMRKRSVLWNNWNRWHLLQRKRNQPLIFRRKKLQLNQSWTRRRLLLWLKSRRRKIVWSLKGLFLMWSKKWPEQGVFWSTLKWQTTLQVFRCKSGLRTRKRPRNLTSSRKILGSESVGMWRWITLHVIWLWTCRMCRKLFTMSVRIWCQKVSVGLSFMLILICRLWMLYQR